MTSSITVFLAVFALGQLAVGPISDRYGRRWPVLTGFAVFLRRQHLVRPRHRPAGPVDRPRHPGRRRVLDLGAVARHRPRSLQRRGAGPRHGADHDRDGGRARLLAAARRRARSLFRLAFRIRLCREFAAIGAIAYAAVLGETHRSTRIPLNPLAIAKNYFGLIADRRFLVPAATVSLIMGGLFAMFSAAPRVLIEGLHFTPIQLGLFFAGTVMIVFAAGMLATRLAPRFGLDRSIRGGLVAAATGSVAILLVSLFNPTFLPFLARDVRVPARHGHRQSARHRAGAVPVRREGRRGLGAGRFLADDERGDRGLARRDGLA